MVGLAAISIAWISFGVTLFWFYTNGKPEVKVEEVLTGRPNCSCQDQNSSEQNKSGV